MQIQASKKGQVMYVRLIGELDHHSAPMFAQKVDALLLQPSIRVLHLDMGGLTFMDSSGIGVLMGRYRRMCERGGKVCVTNASKTVNKIMEMAGLYQIIERVG